MPTPPAKAAPKATIADDCSGLSASPKLVATQMIARHVEGSENRLRRNCFMVKLFQKKYALVRNGLCLRKYSICRTSGRRPKRISNMPRAWSDFSRL